MGVASSPEAREPAPRVSCLTPAVGSAGLSRPAGGTGRGFTRRSRPSARAALRLSAAIRRPHPLPPVPVWGRRDVVLARPRGCTRYGDDVETVYYCVQYTGAVIDVSRHVIVSQWNERKSDMG